jgi:hypothetical protein
MPGTAGVGGKNRARMGLLFPVKAAYAKDGCCIKPSPQIKSTSSPGPPKAQQVTFFTGTSQKT